MTASLPRAKSAQEILDLDDRPTQEVDMPEWGVSLLIREPDAYTSALIAASTERDGKTDNAEFAARTILEGVIEPKFEPHQIEALKKKSNSAFLRLFNAIRAAGKKKEPSTT